MAIKGDWKENICQWTVKKRMFGGQVYGQNSCISQVLNSPLFGINFFIHIYA